MVEERGLVKKPTAYVNDNDTPVHLDLEEFFRDWLSKESDGDGRTRTTGERAPGMACSLYPRTLTRSLSTPR